MINNQEGKTDEEHLEYLKSTKQFWKLRCNVGSKSLFETPDKLWKAACNYFKWLDDNPIEEETLFHHSGIIRKVPKSKVRPYTVGGLCLYLGVAENYFRNFRHHIKDRKEALKEGENQSERDLAFATVIDMIYEICYNQKFTYAAADMLNSNIIARDLGLVDKKALEIPKTIKYQNVSEEFKDDEP